MPISIDEYAKPSWVRYQTRYPLSYDKKDRFNTINPRHEMKRYNGDPETGWKQAGYNPNHNSTRVEKINLTVDQVTLKPR
jgi:hypothetical protein